MAHLVFSYIQAKATTIALSKSSIFMSRLRTIPSKYDKMNSFGEYLQNRRQKLGLLIRKIGAELDISPSILSMIERSEPLATKEILPTLAKILNVKQTVMEIEFIKAYILSDLSGLEETLNSIKSCK